MHNREQGFGGWLYFEDNYNRNYHEISDREREILWSCSKIYNHIDDCINN